jgi:Flp pilus assembly protein TadG
MSQQEKYNAGNATSANVRRRRERGLQLVEVTLVMPVLLLLLAATAEFGRYFFTYSVLARATNTAARHLAGHTLEVSVITEAKNLARCGQKTACSSSVIPELEAGDISVFADATDITNASDDAALPNLPNTITISVNSYYQSVFNLGNWIDGEWTTIPMTPSTTMRYWLAN